MTFAELAELVREMRAAQSRYFRDRDRASLAESKRLERLVDVAVADPADDPQRLMF